MGQRMERLNGNRVRFDILGNLILGRRNRERLSLRAVANDTGISASTICRIENGKSCEMEQVATLARWLGVNVDRFIPSTKDENLPRVVKAMLLADKNLSSDAADAIAKTFTILYRRMMV